MNKRIVYNIVLNYQQQAAGGNAPSPAGAAQQISQLQPTFLTKMNSLLDTLNRNASPGGTRFTTMYDVAQARNTMGTGQFNQTFGAGMSKVVDTLSAYDRHVQASVANARLPLAFQSWQQGQGGGSPLSPSLTQRLHSAITGSRSMSMMGALAYGQPGALGRTAAGLAIQSLVSNTSTVRGMTGSTAGGGGIPLLSGAAAALMDTPLGLVAGGVLGAGALALGAQGMRANARGMQQSIYTHNGLAGGSLSQQLGRALGTPTAEQYANKNFGNDNFIYGFAPQQMLDVYNQLGTAGVPGSQSQSLLKTTLGAAKYMGVDPGEMASLTGNMVSKGGQSADQVAETFKNMEDQMNRTGIPMSKLLKNFQALDMSMQGMENTTVMTDIANLVKTLGTGVNVGQMMAPAMGATGANAIQYSAFLGMSVDQFEQYQGATGKGGPQMGKLWDAYGRKLRQYVGGDGKTPPSEGQLQTGGELLSKMGMDLSGLNAKQYHKALMTLYQGGPNEYGTLSKIFADRAKPGAQTTQDQQDLFSDRVKKITPWLDQVGLAAKTTAVGLANLSNQLDVTTRKGVPGNLTDAGAMDLFGKTVAKVANSQTTGFFQMWNPAKQKEMFASIVNGNASYGYDLNKLGYKKGDKITNLDSSTQAVDPNSWSAFMSHDAIGPLLSKLGIHIGGVDDLVNNMNAPSNPLNTWGNEQWNKINWGDIGKSIAGGMMSAMASAGGTGGGGMGPLPGSYYNPWAGLSNPYMRGGLTSYSDNQLGGGPSAVPGSSASVGGGAMVPKINLNGTTEMVHASAAMYLAAQQAGKQSGIDPRILLAQAARESGLNPNAPGGGLGQFDATAIGEIQSKDPYFKNKKFNPYNMHDSFMGMGWYDQYKGKMFGNTSAYSELYHYNGSGPAAANYAQSVMKAASGVTTSAAIPVEVTGKIDILAGGKLLGQAVLEQTNKAAIKPQRKPVGTRTRHS